MIHPGNEGMHERIQDVFLVCMREDPPAFSQDSMDSGVSRDRKLCKASLQCRWTQHCLYNVPIGGCILKLSTSLSSCQTRCHAADL